MFLAFLVSFRRRSAGPSFLVSSVSLGPFFFFFSSRASRARGAFELSLSLFRFFLVFLVFFLFAFFGSLFCFSGRAVRGFRGASSFFPFARCQRERFVASRCFLSGSSVFRLLFGWRVLRALAGVRRGLSSLCARSRGRRVGSGARARGVARWTSPGSRPRAPQRSRPRHASSPSDSSTSRSPLSSAPSRDLSTPSSHPDRSFPSRLAFSSSFSYFSFSLPALLTITLFTPRRFTPTFRPVCYSPPARAARVFNAFPFRRPLILNPRNTSRSLAPSRRAGRLLRLPIQAGGTKHRRRPTLAANERGRKCRRATAQRLNSTRPIPHRPGAALDHGRNVTVTSRRTSAACGQAQRRPDHGAARRGTRERSVRAGVSCALTTSSVAEGTLPSSGRVIDGAAACIASAGPCAAAASPPRPAASPCRALAAGAAGSPRCPLGQPRDYGRLDVGRVRRSA